MKDPFNDEKPGKKSDNRGHVIPTCSSIQRAKQGVKKRGPKNVLGSHVAEECIETGELGQKTETGSHSKLLTA